jgi:hypothetical protein
MDREQLAEKLDHLDPGASLRIEADILARLFDADAGTDALHNKLETFALEHRCAFTARDHGRAVYCFEKNDIY